MLKFDEYLYKYGLHDCIISKISVKNNSISFEFDSGIYIYNEAGKESEKSKKCTMILKIPELSIDEIEQHVEITKMYKQKFKEIHYDEFSKELDQYGFSIDYNYYSYFDRCILIDGYSSKNRYQIKVSEIAKIDFIFE